MPGFLYFVPDLPRVTPALAAAVSLSYALPSDPVSSAAIERGGPAGRPGAVAWRGAEPRVPFDPASQTWLRATAGDFWIGWETAHRPGPDDLIRPSPLGFYAPTLGDGNAWRVPTAILPDGSCPLPKVWTLNAEGKPHGRVRTDLEQLYLYGAQVRDAIETRVEPSDDDLWTICVTALATNYHLGPDEISILELLTDDARRRICWALVDRANWPDLGTSGVAHAAALPGEAARPVDALTDRGRSASAVNRGG